MKKKIISIKENPITFYALILGIICSFIFYMYCIDLTVRNGVVHNDVEVKLATTENKVSELEYQYMDMQNSITMESASHLGLVEPAEKIFISKHSQTQLSLKN